MPARITEEEFRKRVSENFGDRLDFSETVYKGYSNPVTVRCPKHGYITKDAAAFIKGFGCKYCGYDTTAAALSMTQNEWIERATKVHGGYYGYDKVQYKAGNKKVKIWCPNGHYFEQLAGDHLAGRGCKYCNGNLLLTTEEFIKKARGMHGDKYNYDKVRYVNSVTPVTITCPVHGDFQQVPARHLSGCGCMECARENSKAPIFGVGINDYPYPVKINGEHIISYNYWHHLLKRLYNEESLRREPNYKDVELCEDWKYFSKFKEWFDENYPGGRDDYQLDKDLLCYDLGLKKKIYSPETVCFLPAEINASINKLKGMNGLPVGVQKARTGGDKYIAASAAIGRKTHIGTYNTIEEAFEAYRKVREPKIRALADKYKDCISERAYMALKRFKILPE